MGFAGGFTLGVVQAGFELVGKRELPGGFGVRNCEVNRHLLGDAWTAEACEPERWSVPKNVDFVFGNPPCSGFSVMSSKSFRGADSKINHCMWSFVDYVARANPYVAVFESVQQAFSSAGGLQLMRDLRSKLEQDTQDPWSLFHIRHNAYGLGGAAIRRRYFWTVARIPFGVSTPVVRQLPLFRDVIGDLQNLADTAVAQPYRAPAHPWAERRRAVDPPIVDGHVRVRNPLTSRLGDLLAAVDWKPGESIGEVLRRCYDTHGELPQSFRGNQDKIVKNDFFMGFTTPVRWDGTKPARVVTGGGPVMIVHPWLPRTVTFREVARVMGFPDDWRIAPLVGTPGHSQTWGKGITVDCGRWVASWVRAALEGRPGDYVGTLIGDREFDVDFTNVHRTALV